MEGLNVKKKKFIANHDTVLHVTLIHNSHISTNQKSLVDISRHGYGLVCGVCMSAFVGSISYLQELSEGIINTMNKFNQTVI